MGMSTIGWTAAAVVGVGVGLALYYYLKENEDNVESAQQEEVNEKDLFDWFNSNKDVLKKNPDNIFVLIDPDMVAEQVKKTGKSENMGSFFNTDNNEQFIAQAVYRQSTGKIIKARIIKCTRYSDNLINILERADFKNKKIINFTVGGETKIL